MAEPALCYVLDECKNNQFLIDLMCGRVACIFGVEPVTDKGPFTLEGSTSNALLLSLTDGQLEPLPVREVLPWQIVFEPNGDQPVSLIIGDDVVATPWANLPLEKTTRVMEVPCPDGKFFLAEWVVRESGRLMDGMPHRIRVFLKYLIKELRVAEKVKHNPQGRMVLRVNTALKWFGVEPEHVNESRQASRLKSGAGASCRFHEDTDTDEGYSITVFGALLWCLKEGVKARTLNGDQPDEQGLHAAIKSVLVGLCDWPLQAKKDWSFDFEGLRVFVADLKLDVAELRRSFDEKVKGERQIGQARRCFVLCFVYVY
jgi:hypothetical protein